MLSDIRTETCRGGTQHMKGVGMLVATFELTPKGDRSGRGPSFFGPLKENMLKHRQYNPNPNPNPPPPAPDMIVASMSYISVHS